MINHDDEGNVDYKDCWHPRSPALANIEIKLIVHCVTNDEIVLEIRFGRILCVETQKDVEAGDELFVKYDITVDGDGLKSALKTALSLGQIFSGKSRKEFAKEVKPYIKVISPQTNLKMTI